MLDCLSNIKWTMYKSILICLLNIKFTRYLKCLYFVSDFLKRSLIIFIFKGYQTIVFIFIVTSITFRPICPPTFFRCLSNSGTYTELQTMSFIESTGIAFSDSVSHNRVQVLSIPVLLLACSQDWTWNLQMIVSLEALGINAYNRRTYRTKRSRNSNKDEDNSPITLNDKKNIYLSNFMSLCLSIWY